MLRDEGDDNSEPPKIIFTNSTLKIYVDTYSEVQELRLRDKKRTHNLDQNDIGMHDRFIFWLQILVFLEYLLIYVLYDRNFFAGA